MMPHRHCCHCHFRNASPSSIFPVVFFFVVVLQRFVILILCWHDNDTFMAANHYLSYRVEAAAAADSRTYGSRHRPNKHQKCTVLDSWIQAKCGNNKNAAAALWHYQGVLLDPLTGNEIAMVQGVEMVQPIYWFKNNNDNDNKNEHPGKPSFTTTTSTSTTTSSLAPSKKKLPLSMEWIQQYKQQQSSYKLNDGNDYEQQALALPGADTSSSSSSPPSPPCCQAVTLLSRKMFCYVSPNASSLLRSIRTRPTSPVRYIPLDQAISAYETATTIFEFPRRQQSPFETKTTSSSRSTDDPNDSKPFIMDCPQWSVHSEWPDGRCLWNTVQVRSMQRPKSNTRNGGLGFFLRPWKREQQPQQRTQELEFSIVYPQAPSVPSKHSPNDFFHRLRMMENNNDSSSRSSSSSSSTNNPDGSSTQTTTSSTNPSSTSSLSSPPRASWISVGMSGSSSSRGPHHRETYHYSHLSDTTTQTKPAWWPWHPKKTTSSADPILRYQRYGEGPVWYGPHRMCLMELQGKRLSTPRQLPPILREWTVKTRFFVDDKDDDRHHQLDTTKTTHDIQQHHSITSREEKLWSRFRNQPFNTQSALEGVVDDQNVIDAPFKPPSWIQPTFNRVQNALMRFREATTLELGGGGSS